MGTASHLMKFFVAVSTLVASTLASPQILAPGAYGGAYYPGAPYAAYAAPYHTGSQFHAQDEFGNLNYGYANLNSAKQEVGNTYGGVAGGYSYVDSAGVLQQVNYVADGAGFRVKTLVFLWPQSMMESLLPSTLSLSLLLLSTLSLWSPLRSLL